MRGVWMTSKLERLAQLRELLARMEGELGLDGLSRFERDILYAIRALSGDGQAVASSDLRRHGLIESMSQPTYHRALRELVTRGYIANTDGRRWTYTGVAPTTQTPK